MLRSVMTCAALLLGAALSRAEIVIAQVSPASGPLSITAIGNSEGAQAYIDSVNARGGVHGQRIRFVHEDDQYKPEETVRLIEAVARRDQPLVFLNLFGSANTLAIQQSKVLDRVKTPAVGATPGAESMRMPGSPWIFHVHAGDRAQIQYMLRHLSTLGLQNVAVAYQDNPFGKSGLAFFDEAAGALKLTVSGRVPVAPTAEALKDTAKKLQSTGAQTYVMLLVRNSAAAMVRDVRAAGDRTPIYGMSYAPVEAILQTTPLSSAAGVGLAQILPNAAAQKVPLTREFHASMARYMPKSKPSNPHLTGYVAARVAVEAIRRAGPGATPERVSSVLRQLRMDLGGFSIDFTSGSNVGTQWVDIGVLDSQGRLML